MLISPVKSIQQPMQKLLRAKQLGFDFSLLLLVYLQRDLLGVSNNL